MIKKSVLDLNPEPVEADGARKVGIRVMISESDGAPNFNLRVFDVAPGGNTPHHSHDYEHELFILEGEGELLSEGEWLPIKPYDTILVMPDEEHSIRNSSEGLLRMICLVPQTG